MVVGAVVAVLDIVPRAEGSAVDEIRARSARQLSLDGTAIQVGRRITLAAFDFLLVYIGNDQIHQAVAIDVGEASGNNSIRRVHFVGRCDVEIGVAENGGRQ